jgi:hypothetical protein
MKKETWTNTVDNQLDAQRPFRKHANNTHTQTREQLVHVRMKGFYDFFKWLYVIENTKKKC